MTAEKLKQHKEFTNPNEAELPSDVLNTQVTEILTNFRNALNFSGLAKKALHDNYTNVNYKEDLRVLKFKKNGYLWYINLGNLPNNSPEERTQTDESNSQNEERVVWQYLDIKKGPIGPEQPLIPVYTEVAHCETLGIPVDFKQILANYSILGVPVKPNTQTAVDNIRNLVESFSRPASLNDQNTPSK